MSDCRLSPQPLARVTDLLAIAGQLSPSTAILAGGHRAEDLRLVELARDHGFVDRVILVGHQDRMAAAVKESGIEVAEDDLIAAEGDEQIAAATIEAIKAGGVDLVLSGDIAATVMDRHILPLAVRPTVSRVTVFDAEPIAGGRVMLLAGAGAAADDGAQRLMGVIDNVVEVAQAVLGIERPRVAVLAGGKAQLPPLGAKDAAVCGPLPFDLATDAAAVAAGGMPDRPGAAEVAGQADALVTLGEDAADVLYKVIAALARHGEASLASITLGLPVPYVVLSRCDALETRLLSIALCAVYARRRPQEFFKDA